MKNPTINLRDVAILIADANPHIRRIVTGMLRGFGASKTMEAENTTGLFQSLSHQKIDILLCDMRLPPYDALKITRSIRSNADRDVRTMPILLISSDTSAATIRNARDAGANIVVAKPMSPNSLYDRLGWILSNPRPFVDTPSYFGPDRRFKIEGCPHGVGRRKDDKTLPVAVDDSPASERHDIDTLLSATYARTS